MLRLAGLPAADRYPEATVWAQEGMLYMRFCGLEGEERMRLPLGYLGEEDEEAAELRLLARLQQAGYRVRRGP
ncbi:MAG: hypothetical protein AB1425_09855 [Actinomycetota bacterium]